MARLVMTLRITAPRQANAHAQTVLQHRVHMKPAQLIRWHVTPICAPLTALENGVTGLRARFLLRHAVVLIQLVRSSHLVCRPCGCRSRIAKVNRHGLGLMLSPFSTAAKAVRLPTGQRKNVLASHTQIKSIARKSELRTLCSGCRTLSTRTHRRLARGRCCCIHCVYRLCHLLFESVDVDSCRIYEIAFGDSLTFSSFTVNDAEVYLVQSKNDYIDCVTSGSSTEELAINTPYTWHTVDLSYPVRSSATKCSEELHCL